MSRDREIIITRALNENNILKQSIGFDFKKDSIEYFKETVFLTGEQLEYKENKNGRFDDFFYEAAKNGDILAKKVKGNKRRLQDVLNKNLEKESQYICLSERLVCIIREALVRFSTYSNLIRFGKCEKDCVELLKMFPSVKDKYLVIDGNTFWCISELCYRVLRSKSTQVKKSLSLITEDEKIIELASYYDKKPIAGEAYTESIFLETDTDYIKDLKIIEVIIGILKKNMSSWNNVQMKRYRESIIRILNVVFQHYLKDDCDYGFDIFLQKLYYAKYAFLLESGKFSSSSYYDKELLNALFYESSSLEKMPELTGTIINNGFLRRIFEAIISADTRVYAINLGFEYMKLAYDELVKYQTESSKVKTDRERINKIVAATKKDSEAQAAMMNLINKIDEQVNAAALKTEFDVLFGKIQAALNTYFGTESLNDAICKLDANDFLEKYFYEDSVINQAHVSELSEFLSYHPDLINSLREEVVA